MDFKGLTEVMRQFQFDYIYVDAFFLFIWLIIILKNKKTSALFAGFILAILVYFIDAVIWWNAPAGANFPGRNVREYWIGGNTVLHGWNSLTLMKFAADFMMTISYALFAFTWLWIMFESWFSKKFHDMFLYSSLLFGSWLLIPFISLLIPLNDTMVISLRHMESQFITQIVVVLIGYLLMILLYCTKLFHSFDPKVIFYIFGVGCFQAFAMEFPLWISNIRPSGVDLLIYEVLILTNQGAPYLYIVWDKILPALKLRKDQWKNYFLNWKIVKSLAIQIEKIVNWDKFNEISQKFGEIPPVNNVKDFYIKIKENVNIDQFKAYVIKIDDEIKDRIHWDKINNLACNLVEKLNFEKIIEFSKRYGERIKIKIDALKMAYVFIFQLSKMKPSQIREIFKKDEIFAQGIVLIESTLS
ncbi:MAG: hypothetical protein ACTSWX_11835 [Promethearchaeota archaeon]